MIKFNISWAQGPDYVLLGISKSKIKESSKIAPACNFGLSLL